MEALYRLSYEGIFYFIVILLPFYQIVPLTVAADPVLTMDVLYLVSYISIFSFYSHIVAFYLLLPLTVTDDLILTMSIPGVLSSYIKC